MDRTVDELMLQVLQAEAAVEIRNVDQGEEPFLYSSGNWGPGYVSIKSLVGRHAIMKALTDALGAQVAEVATPQFVAANVSGGMIPGWLVSEYLGIPCVYVRETRKRGGQQEHVTGMARNPEIPLGSNGVVTEELVNFAQTTCNSAGVLRNAGYTVTHAACVLFYDNPEAIKALERNGIQIVYLFTLPQLLDCADRHGTHDREAIEGYREFLRNPLDWQAKRKLQPVEGGGIR